MSDLDRHRAARLMREAGMEALVLFQPEAFRYATGLDQGVASMWRRGGAGVALVPADAAAPIAAVIADHALRFGRPPVVPMEIVTHPIWIDYLDHRPNGRDALVDLAAAYRAHGLGAPRPESFDAAQVFGLLGEIVAARRLDRAVVGVDLEFLPAADFHALRRALPGVDWVDGSEVLRRLRCIKSNKEVERLQKASDASEAGMAAMAEAARPGMRRSDLDRLWREGVDRQAARAGIAVSDVRHGIAVGPDLVAADPVLGAGDLIKADMGVAVGGYLSDGTRTYAMGQPVAAATRIWGVIEEAFEAGLAAIRPGAALGEVHAAVLATTARLGLPHYRRGHFGHSIGASCGSEEWPFISEGNPEPIAPGMVLAFEVPFYLHGIGAMMIEDQVEVTSAGARSMNRLPRGLRVLPL